MKECGVQKIGFYLCSNTFQDLKLNDKGGISRGIIRSSGKEFFFLRWGRRQYKLESNTELKDQCIIMDLSVAYSSLFESNQV